MWIDVAWLVVGLVLIVAGLITHWRLWAAKRHVDREFDRLLREYDAEQAERSAIREVTHETISLLSQEIKNRKE